MMLHRLFGSRFVTVFMQEDQTPQQQRIDRNLKIAGVLFAASLLFALGAIIYVFVYQPAPSTSVMGDYESPRHMAITRPGVEGPAATEVGMILVRGKRCIHGPDGRTITVEQYITYRRADVPLEEASTVPDSTYGDLVPRADGCFVQEMILVLPPRVTPGRWYIDAVEVAPISGELRRWTSEPFTVVGRP